MGNYLSKEETDNVEEPNWSEGIRTSAHVY